MVSEKDIWGYGVFGHGQREGTLAGNLLWSGSAIHSWGRMILAPSVIGGTYHYGAGLLYFCYAEKNRNSWRAMVSERGVFYSTRGYLWAIEGFSAFGEKSWEDIVDQMTTPWIPLPDLSPYTQDKEPPLRFFKDGIEYVDDAREY